MWIRTFKQFGHTVGESPARLRVSLGTEVIFEGEVFAPHNAPSTALTSTNYGPELFSWSKPLEWSNLAVPFKIEVLSGEIVLGQTLSNFSIYSYSPFDSYRFNYGPVYNIYYPDGKVVSDPLSNVRILGPGRVDTDLTPSLEGRLFDGKWLLGQWGWQVKAGETLQASLNIAAPQPAENVYTEGDDQIIVPVGYEGNIYAGGGNDSVDISGNNSQIIIIDGLGNDSLFGETPSQWEDFKRVTYINHDVPLVVNLGVDPVNGAFGTATLSYATLETNSLARVDGIQGTFFDDVFTVGPYWQGGRDVLPHYSTLNNMVEFIDSPGDDTIFGNGSVDFPSLATR